MSLPDILRTSIFRLTAIFAVVFVLSTGVLFAFIYWQTAVYENRRIDTLLTQEADVVARESDDDIRRTVETRIAGDFHRMTYAALMDRDGRAVAGNLQSIPRDVPVDGTVHRAEITRNEDGVSGTETVLLLAKRLSDGRILAVGRSIDEVENLASLVRRALELGGIPTLTLAILAGMLLSLRALRQVKAVHQTAERIMLGDLRERLPTLGRADEFDRLATSVNKMLDEIERLVGQVKGVSDNIAHDLRTPLTRMHTRLERARNSARTYEELQECIDRALVDLDVTLGIITALLRIGEIEDGQRRAAFCAVDPAAVVRGVVELYEPVAEEKQIDLAMDLAKVRPVRGDRELLTEAVANLVDNAIKFSRPGGRVRVSVVDGPNGPVVRVADDGPGIPADEREAIFQRFYRSDSARSVQGSGLGLSLVQAIADLHHFRVIVSDGAPGSVFALECSASAIEPRSGPAVTA